ncbi:MAG: ImmA/IrrE family metallo-endopeptidase [Candidatus Aminicenantes bacterium]|nr:ImmA/IrrE family metallo-endopeptidase [Candidatus Aminicenantes bacterium]
MTKKQKEIRLSSEVLKALRETSGYSVEEIAKKLNTSKEKVSSVEEGKTSFTLTQIKKLAEIYKRPLVAFFSSSIPELPKSPDYRINREKRLTPYVYLAERRAHFLSEKIKELSGKKTQIPTFSEELKADELAREFRKTLSIELIKHRKSDEILAYYKKVLEDALTILIIEYPLKADDVRAFSIYSELSCVVLNEEDKPSIKLFSLFHEICHLIRKTGGICSLELEQSDRTEEWYCNSFAAEFLVPSEDLRGEVEKYKPVDEEAINQLTELYGVSKQVIMIRLLQERYIEERMYEEFKRKMVESVRQEKKFGRKNWDKVFLNRVGNFALREIRNAYNKEIITFYEASSITGLKTKYAEKFITA